MASEDIGCSLAEAAETPLYNEYLGQAAQTGQPAMHVVYINTSLRTKAEAHAVVPTITCTSSNVVQTVLQVRVYSQFRNTKKRIPITPFGTDLMRSLVIDQAAQVS